MEYSTQMKLTIRNLSNRDFGSYKCISKNSLGDAEGSIHLYGEFLVKAPRKNEAAKSARKDPGKQVARGLYWLGLTKIKRLFFRGKKRAN